MSEFSLALNEDQLQIQKWVHDFAETVVRPAAEEWDEREEFPWPIVEEAAKIGLYGFDFFAQTHRWATPPASPCRSRSRSCSGATPASACRIFGSGLAAAGIAGNGTPEQVMEWVPQCYGTAREDPARRLLRVRARRRLRRVVAAHTGRLRRGQGRVGAQRHQGVDHQRRHRRRPRRRRRRRPRAQGPGPGQLRRPARHPGPVAGPEVQEARHPRVAHRRGRARRRAGPRLAACSAARRSSTRSWPGPEGAAEDRRASSRRWPPSRPPARPSAPWPIGIARAAYEYSLDYAKERKAFGKADHPEPGASPSCSPT